MTERLLAGELAKHAGGTVRLEGWIHRRRRLASVTFLIVRDRSGLAQVVVEDDDVRALLETLGEETVVRVEGDAVANEKAPGGVEVVAPSIVAMSEPAATPPIDLWRPTVTASLPTLLDHAAVSWRHPRRQAVLRITAASVAGFRAALDSSGFVEVQTPKIVASSTESGANVFAIDYFGRPAYLAQSPQFYKQMMVGVHERVYEVGPVFRAEPHDTARHLSEYVSLDAELGFIADHRDVLRVLRDVLATMVETIREGAADAVELLGVTLPDIPSELPVVDFAEALRIAGADADEPDLAPADERRIGAWARATYGSDLVAVEGYPMAKRPFYTHPRTGDPRWSNSFDVLFRGLELVTGGQRLHRHSDYVAALQARGEPLEAYEGYLAAFAHGMPPHGGFATGLERWVGRLIEAENIRETTLFPRDLTRLAP